LDGRKYLNRRTTGDFSGTIKAYTYPDEFLVFDGMQDFSYGIKAMNQPVNQTFGLSFRTKIGTDLNSDAAYKIHLLYNLTAAPDSRSYPTIGSRTAPMEFSWKITGIPLDVTGFKPTCQFVIDSSKFAPGGMSGFENYLYGTTTSTGQLPDPDMLLDLYANGLVEPLTEPV
jgi:hypothetical protein